MNQLDEKIINLICQGNTAKEIGKYLSKSKGYIEKRVKQLRKQHNCRSTAQLIAVLKSAV